MDIFADMATKQKATRRVPTVLSKPDSIVLVQLRGKKRNAARRREPARIEGVFCDRYYDR